MTATAPILDLPIPGSLPLELHAPMAAAWAAEALAGGRDFAGFDPSWAPGAALARARGAGLPVAAAYTRHEGGGGGDLPDAALGLARHAARIGVFASPLLACADAGAGGEFDPARRAGLRRLESILGRGPSMAEVLLLPRLACLCRRSGAALEFLRERVVAGGLRVVVFRDGIDTAASDGGRVRSLLDAIEGVLPKPSAASPF